MGRKENARQAEENARLVEEIAHRNPLRTLEATDAWSELRDAVDAVRANTVDCMDRLAQAYVNFKRIASND